MLHDTTGKKEMVACYMDSPVPYDIEEKFGGCFFEDDVDLALILQDQVFVPITCPCLTWLSLFP